jgi:hypothetical protein
MLEGMGAHYLQSLVLIHLGDAREATGNRDEARRAWQQALAMLDDLRHPEAERARARLSGFVPAGGSRATATASPAAADRIRADDPVGA